MKDDAEKTSQTKDTSAAQQPQGQQSDMAQGQLQAAPSSQSNEEQSRARPQRGGARHNWFTPPYWMEHLLEDLGVGWSLFGSRAGHEQELGLQTWAPQVEAYEHDQQFVVSVDLPGMKKDDIQVEFSENTLTIQGERRQEYEETQTGYQRSERSYGSFYRRILLPEDVDAENAKATFRDGVLKITMPLPPQQEQHSRRIEIQAIEDQPLTKLSQRL